MVKFLGLGLVFCLSFTLQSDGIIKNMYPFLIGDYQLVKIVDGKKVKNATDLTESFSLKVQKNDLLIVYKNKKKFAKYKFTSATLPFLQDENHIVISVNDEFQPVFYRKDTLILNNFPEEFLDNYFVKVKK